MCLVSTECHCPRLRPPRSWSESCPHPNLLCQEGAPSRASRASEWPWCSERGPEVGLSWQDPCRDTSQGLHGNHTQHLCSVSQVGQAKGQHDQGAYCSDRQDAQRGLAADGLREDLCQGPFCSPPLPLLWCQAREGSTNSHIQGSLLPGEDLSVTLGKETAPDSTTGRTPNRQEPRAGHTPRGNASGS